MVTFPIGFFGKLPCNGDFLRYGNNTAFLSRWDPWLQESLYYCQQTLGEEPWLSIYLTSPLWRFILPRGVIDKQVYVGFVMPSVDAVGRYFSFTLYVALNQDTQIQAFMAHSHKWFRQTEHFVLSLLEKDHYPTPDIQQQLNRITEALNKDDYLPPLESESAIVFRSTQSDRHEEVMRLHRLYLNQQPNKSLWWTDGSEQLHATTLSLHTLPTTHTFLAMMDGQWSRASLEPNAMLDAQPPSAAKSAINPPGTPQAGKRLSYGLSHPGHVRKTNEDLYLNEPHRQLWAVADGMGGHSRGDIASYKLGEALRATPLSSDMSTATDMICRSVAQVNKELYTLSDEIIGTTLALFFITDGQALCLWAGDSRIYRLDSQGAFQQLTQDHAEDNRLTHAIGADEQVYLERKLITVFPGDRFLICSDGLYNAMSHTQIHTVLQEEISPKNACKELIARVLATTAEDNLTAIVIDPYGE